MLQRFDGERVHTETMTTLAETVIGLYKTEFIWHCGPWRGIDGAEYATLD